MTTTLLVSALVVYSAQGMLVPVLAPVTRLVGLGEVDLGAVMTLSAAMLVVAGPWWGREVDRIGVHAVLVRGLLIATVGAVGFAVMTEFAAREELPRWVVLGAFALTRGVLYGLGFAAVPVAALTYLASTSQGAIERTKAMGAFGAVQGISLVVGPALGGLAAIGGLLLPVYLAPVLVGATLVAVWLLPVPERQERPERERLGFRDPRVLPFLLAGGALFLGLALVEIILGFLVQDRLGLSDTATAQVVAVAGVLIGIGFAVTQAFVAPRVPGGPRALIVVGSLVAAVGYTGAVYASSTATLLPAMVVVAAGLGLAVPGYNAGATLAVEPSEHAAVAGQLSATVGLTYVAGPVLGAGLYGFNDVAPIVGAALLSIVAAALAAARLQPVAR
ncbi:MFS transporter [Aeromicrobium choanae]|uniref:Major Facilitator Superfamily protein n=1 Tax=Aeromicrobium choanae TaxID=1736691 RepID=A0A1T4YXG9_9ACTN|nr:MFS transporter [Aeromicrobium choanae]SKB06474.1 Major Facilitator Superfamily protein [Aeromicrobium choanae]